MTTDVLNLLSQIMAGITVLALLWLAARAFKKHTAWGLGMLLAPPVTAVAFGIRHWDREKLPFLAFAGTFAVTAGLLVTLFGAWGGWEMLQASKNAEQALQTRTLTRSHADAFKKASLSFNEKSGISYPDRGLNMRIQRELERKAEHAQINARAAEMEAQDEEENYTLEDLYRRTPKVEKERFRLVYKPIRVSDAHKYVGTTVKVTRKNVQEKEYRLVGATGGSLQFAQKSGRGSFSFAYRKRDIEKIRILIKQPY